MSAISIERLSVLFGDFRAVDEISLELKDGEFVVFLGPSGCGKTTTLRTVAGLQEASGGEVRFDGESVLALSPSERNVAMVFQSVSLYPHLTVAGNIAFPLKARGESRQVVRERLQWVAGVLHLEGLMSARPGGLPPGALQRVALARAIVRRPRVLLLDEPLSAVDEQFRENMRWELGHIQRELGVTTIYVTHDQREAMALADRIVLMRDGRIEQFGTADDLYFRPASAFTGYFIGSPSMNFLPIAAEDGALSLGGARLHSPEAAAKVSALGQATLGLRPQHVALGGETGAPLEGASEILPFVQGRERLFSFKIGDEVFLGRDERGEGSGADQVRLDLSHGILFERESGRRLEVSLASEAP